MVKIPSTMRPGVFTHTDVRSVLSAGALRGVAAVGQASGDNTGGVVSITSLSQAAVFGVDSALYRMAETLIQAGAAPIYAVAAGSDYSAAFAMLELLHDVAAVVCDGGDTALAAHITLCCGQGRERIGIVAVSDAAEAGDKAPALNNEHIVVVCDGGSRTEVTAAAFAAVVADLGGQSSLSGAAIPFCGTFDGTLGAVQIEHLLQAGVTPFERCGDQVECIRAVTTRTRTDGFADRTFANLSVVLAIDDVAGTVRRAVRARLRGLKNNAVTRESIASQITVELEAKRTLGIIDSYQPPAVAVHPQDATVCVATMAFRVAPEINQIVISAEIQI